MNPREKQIIDIVFDKFGETPSEVMMHKAKALAELDFKITLNQVSDRTTDSWNHLKEAQKNLDYLLEDVAEAMSYIETVFDLSTDENGCISPEGGVTIAERNAARKKARQVAHTVKHRANDMADKFITAVYLVTIPAISENFFDPLRETAETAEEEKP